MSVQTKDSKPLDKNLLIKWIITLIVSILPLFFPLSEVFTMQVQRFLIFTLLGIFILAFELMNGFAVAMLMTVGWVLSGATTFAVALSAWTTSNLIMPVCAMVLINVLQKVGVLQRLGYWCIVKTGGSFKGLTWGLFFTCLVIMFVGFVLTMTLTFAFAYALYKALDLKPTDKESVVIVWTTAIGGIFSGVFLYCPITIALVNASAGAVIPDFTFSWYQVMFYNMPMLFVSLFLVWLGLKWYEKTAGNTLTDASKGKEYFLDAYQRLGKISLNERKCIVILVLLAAYLFTQPLHGLDSAYGFIVGVILCFCPWFNLGDNDCVKNVPWDNMFIIGAFLGIGTIATQLGLSTMVSNAFIPLISSMGGYWSIMGTTLLAGLVNFILSPFAMTAVLPGPIAQYCLGAGYNAMPHILTLYIAKEIVFLPYEYPGYLILFAFGMVKMGSMIKICTIKSLLIIIAIAVVMMPYWVLLGIL